MQLMGAAPVEAIQQTMAFLVGKDVSRRLFLPFGLVLFLVLLNQFLVNRCRALLGEINGSIWRDFSGMNVSPQPRHAASVDALFAVSWAFVYLQPHAGCLVSTDTD